MKKYSTAWLKSIVLGLMVLTSLQSPARGDAADTEVSCVSMESCVLLCSFQGGSDVVIHWIQLAGDMKVHSYYYNQDQLDNQDQRFRNRTSLFNEQISGGNASLQLTGVEVQDQGRYLCYTSTITGYKESFINLKVEDAAPTNPPSVPPSPPQPSVKGEEEPSAGAAKKTNIGLITAGVVGAILVVAATAAYFICKNRKGRTGEGNPAAEAHEMKRVE